MSGPVIYLIDDDEAMRASLAFMLDCKSFPTQTFASAIPFLEQVNSLPPGCVVTDVRMPEISGLDLVRRLKAQGVTYPVIVITGHGDVHLAVEAMKAGAADFLEKPFDDEELLRAIRAALAQGVQSSEEQAEQQNMRTILASLSPRESEVLKGVVDGKMNKIIAYELGISPRTVEVYRANMMSKTGARNLSELVRMVMLARS